MPKEKAITYHMVVTNVHTDYNRKKRFKKRSLTPIEFVNLVKGVFKYFNLERTKGSQAESWYRSIMISFGSRGGSKKPRKKKG